MSKYIHSLASTLTVTEQNLDENPVLTGITGENILNPYLLELMVEQNK